MMSLLLGQCACGQELLNISGELRSACGDVDNERIAIFLNPEVHDVKYGEPHRMVKTSSKGTFTFREIKSGNYLIGHIVPFGTETTVSELLPLSLSVGRSYGKQVIDDRGRCIRGEIELPTKRVSWKQSDFVFTLKRTQGDFSVLTDETSSRLIRPSVSVDGTFCVSLPYTGKYVAELRLLSVDGRGNPEWYTWSREVTVTPSMQSINYGIIAVKKEP